MLSPDQFGHFSPEEVGVLRAGDFPGSIGDRAARSRFERYNQADSILAKHREAGGPLPYLDQFIDKVRQAGKIEDPIEVHAHDDYFSIHDGHHRAMAAQATGLPLPYKIVKDNRAKP